jgi:hypothetical protein
LIVTRNDLRAYHIDAFTYAHARQLDEPSLTPDERWLTATPAQQADAFERSAEHRFSLVLDDLAALPIEPPVIVEGPQILPGLLPEDAVAVFLVSTEGFQERMLAGRGGLSAASDPERALRNRIERDRLLAVRMRAAADGSGAVVIDIDGTRDVADITAEVEAVFVTALGDPQAEVDLSAVRRWENEAIAANIRAWLASPEAPRVVPQSYPYACECGRRGCMERVALRIDKFDRLERVLAPPHDR